MYKLIGVILLVSASSYIGLQMSVSLKNRIVRLELLRRMVQEIITLIKFRALTVNEIINEITGSGAYSQIKFLEDLKVHKKPAQPFRTAWENAVKNDGTLFDEERNEMLMLGSTIGTSDIDGQVSSLTIAKQKLEAIIQNANNDYSSKGKLYRTLGVLSGVFISILLI